MYQVLKGALGFYIMRQLAAKKSPSSWFSVLPCFVFIFMACYGMIFMVFLWYFLISDVFIAFVSHLETGLGVGKVWYKSNVNNK